MTTNVQQLCDSWRFSRQFCKGDVIKSVTFYFFREGFLVLFSLIISKLQ